MTDLDNLTTNDFDTHPGVKWYDHHAKQYTQDTLERDTSAARSLFTKFLKPGARVLDLGCGSGRDVKHFLDAGYDAFGRDGSPNMLFQAILHTKLPDRINYEKFETYSDAPCSWDGIWAMASLLHIPQVARAEIFARILTSLKDDGVFLAYFKSGSGEIVDAVGRPFTLLSPGAAIDIFMPLLKDHQRLHVGTVSVPDSLGAQVDWTEVLIHA
jgi:SAM-dependent methyltransferase